MTEAQIKALVEFQQRMRCLKQGRDARIEEKEKAAKKRMKKNGQVIPAPSTIIRGDLTGEDYGSN